MLELGIGRMRKAGTFKTKRQKRKHNNLKISDYKKFKAYSKERKRKIKAKNKGKGIKPKGD